MNYAKIRNYDIANGEGVRTSLFVSGCTNHCPGCFNPEEWDFNCGRPFTKETIAEIHKMLANPVISGLSLLGGDPLCQDYGGIYDLIDLCFYTHSSCDSKQAHELLTEGQVYEVEKIHVGGWCSSIRLKEFPGKEFNTVHFIRYE